MVALNVDRNDNLDPPDLFRAAREDDVAELHFAMECGRNLDSIDPQTGLSVLHLAFYERSDKFIAASMKYRFNPWIKDRAGRMLIDHAASHPRYEAIHEYIRKAMYPDGWQNRIQPSEEPSP